MAASFLAFLVLFFQHQASAVQAKEPLLSPAPSLAFGDYDGDGLIDALAIEQAVERQGALRLLRNLGDGAFEDVSASAGLGAVRRASLILWEDYDQDGKLDLFVAAACGPRYLFQNQGDGWFADTATASGLAGEACNERRAQWVDYDRDGRLDLYLEGAGGSRLFHALHDGRFEQQVLTTGEAAPTGSTSPFGVSESGTADGLEGETGEPGGAVLEGTEVLGRSRGLERDTLRPAGTMPMGGSEPMSPGNPLPIPIGCAETILDQDDSGCMEASSTPTLGKLYPISSNLFVEVGGDVGIGTTTPAARLDVAGTARMSDTLTLAPSGDTALDVSTGSIYKGGALFLHNKGGANNTALGLGSLTSVTTGSSNTAVGHNTLTANTVGTDNTATGTDALRYNTAGSQNTATGRDALRSNTTGNANAAHGNNALEFNTIGDANTADGNNCLRYNVSGNANTAAGNNALMQNTTGSNNSAVGNNALLNNTSGTANTAAGEASLRENTIGIDNAAFGADALRYNTAGSHNTAMGRSALRSSTTAADNAAFGRDALRYNTTGSQNVATGRDALRSNTTGNANAAHGNNALEFNTTANANTALGNNALRYNTTGTINSAVGNNALMNNATASANTAVGNDALRANTTGIDNAGCGADTLRYSTTGNHNAAAGRSALRFNTTGSDNTAMGRDALRNNTTGDGNIALGRSAGLNLTTGSDNIAIGNAGVAAEAATIRIGTAGTQTRAFIAGIRGVTTGVANGITVLIDSAGQLGTVSSSRRFKEEIRDMGSATDQLLELRPVVFRYKPEVQQGERPLEYGLIAEEVAEIFPDLVVYDEEGKPFTVKYHVLSSMLLNELKQQASELADLRERFASLEGRILQSATLAQAR